MKIIRTKYYFIPIQQQEATGLSLEARVNKFLKILEETGDILREVKYLDKENAYIIYQYKIKKKFILF